MSSFRQRSTQPHTSDTAAPPLITSDIEIQQPPRPPQSALSQALESSAHLANLLPTGTILAFQLLTPIFTNNGSCDTATRPMAFILLMLLSVSCFIASFTDSIKASDGKIHYGFVTFKGLWLFDYPASGLQDLSKYRLSFMDVVHAVLSVVVFGAVALRDTNVVNCFYPSPGHGVQGALNIVPFGIGILSSLLFVVYPTRRHGIGYPVWRK